MSPVRYLMTVLALFAALGIGEAVFAWSEMGRPTARGYANCAYVQRKIELASAVPSPKLLIVGGSNAAAGIDVSALSQSLPVRAFNFSLFATFSPGFQLYEARKVLHRGDAVLLAFEYLAYEYEVPTNALLDTVYSCGVDYWTSLDWSQRLRYAFALRPQRFFSTLMLNSAKIDSAQKMIAVEIAEDGDLGNPFPDPTPQSDAHQPLVIRFRAGSSGVSQIADFLRWAPANGVTVFATWPNTLYFDEYQRNPAFGQIAEFYRSHDIGMIGQPGDAMVSHDYLAETIYHLTIPGIAFRTQRLVGVLQENPEFEAWRENAQSLLPDDGSPIAN